MLLGLLSLLADLHHLALRQPITDDRAYLLYMAQAVFRGDSLYGSTTFGYPPYSALLVSFVMWIGSLFDLPTYLSPRYASLLVGPLNAFLIYAVARRAFGSRLTGLFAGLMLIGFQFANAFDATSLEPKTLVISCILCAVLAVQREKWLWAGIAAAVAGMIWQPAIVVCLSILVPLLATRHRSFRVLGRFAGGVVLGTLPALIYPIMQGDWRDFITLVIVRKMALNLPGAGNDIFEWTSELFSGAQSELIVLLLAFAGFTLYVGRRIADGRNGARYRFPHDGGLVSVTIGWIIMNSIDCDGEVDLIPFLPMLAIFGAYGYQELLHVTARTFQPRNTVWIAVVLLVVYLFEDEFRRRSLTFTLPDQEAMVRTVLESDSDRENFVALDAEEFYVLADRAAPIRYTRADKWVEQLIEIVDPGSGSVLEQAKASSPDLIVVKQKRPRKRTTVDRFAAVFSPEYELESREIPYETQYPQQQFPRKSEWYERTLWLFRKAEVHDIEGRPSPPDPTR